MFLFDVVVSVCAYYFLLLLVVVAVVVVVLLFALVQCYNSFVLFENAFLLLPAILIHFYRTLEL